MKIEVKTASPEAVRTAALVVAIPEGAKRPPARLAALDKALGGAIARTLSLHPDAGKFKEATLVVAEGAKAERVYLLGVGDPRKLGGERIRDAAGQIARLLRDRGAAEFALDLVGERADAEANARALAEGVLMGLYENDAFMTEKKKEKKVVRAATILADEKSTVAAREGVRVGRVLGEAVNRCRSLADRPGNEMTPTMLAAAARKMATEKKLRCQVLDAAAMKKLGMGALLGVAKGSAEPPKLIVLEHNPARKAKGTICIVGKGLTFDSGGISIKPAGKMWEMKYDMCGGAATIAVLGACADLGIARRVVGVVPATENMPGGRAQKPGDVAKAMNGLTIEVQNTDAEGRLILADALYYAATKFKPEAMVDMATLTGAVIVALGHLATGLMATDAKLAERIKRAAEASGERVWELPLWEEYDEQIKSDTCDVKNIGNGGEAGTIIGGAFLKKFVNGVPWAHLDIAGTAWGVPSKGHFPGSLATGAGIRLLAQMLLDWK